MVNIDKAITAKRGKRRLFGRRFYPKWERQGVWFFLPERLQAATDFAFGAGYHIRIEALMCLRKYLSASDPFLVATEIDNIRLIKMSGSCPRKGNNDWSYSHYRPLTVEEKRFVTGRNHV